MLTADLLRVRDNGKVIAPRYLKLNGKAAPKLLARAEAMVGVFSLHEGARRTAIDEAISDLIGDGTDFNLVRGLKKLLEDRCEFSTVSVAPPTQVRERLFEIAAAHHPIVEDPNALHTHTRDEVLQKTAAAIEAELPPQEGRPRVTPSDVEEAIYADLNENQRLVSFKDIAPLALLERYNLALAQAVLYRARQLRITLTGGTVGQRRQLFRTLKFHRLMHRIEKGVGRQWVLTIDGPISLLKSTNKYGLQMAIFLPALLLAEGWRLEADLAWGKTREPRVFELDDACGLVSHYKARGNYVTDEQKHFEAGFKALGSPWTLSRRTSMHDLGGRDVLIPDLVFKHREDGRVAMLDIVGFWRRGWLKSKAEALEKHGPSNLIIAVSDRLLTEKGGATDDLPITLLPFKGVILPKKVLALVEDVALSQD